MCNICIPILVGGASLVLELKFGKTFFFGPWTIVNGDKKYNLLKKFMQVEVDVMT